MQGIAEFCGFSAQQRLDQLDKLAAGGYIAPEEYKAKKKAIYFWRAIWHVKAVIVVLFALVVAGGGAVTHVEKMPFGDALYFAPVTGLTIGYGDIIVKTTLGRWIALLIGLVGILFSGLMVAVLVHAVQESMKKK
jgi:voltage-gated potassium channel